MSWFHGSAAELAPGEMLVPGDRIGRDNFPGMDNSWGVWITPDPKLAALYGANVYQVEPTGHITDWAAENGWDPDETNSEYVCDKARVSAVLA